MYAMWRIQQTADERRDVQVGRTSVRLAAVEAISNPTIVSSTNP
jgi:hypothetical protein